MPACTVTNGFDAKQASTLLPLCHSVSVSSWIYCEPDHKFYFNFWSQLVFHNDEWTNASEKHPLQMKKKKRAFQSTWMRVRKAARLGILSKLLLKTVKTAKKCLHIAGSLVEGTSWKSPFQQMESLLDAPFNCATATCAVLTQKTLHTVTRFGTEGFKASNGCSQTHLHRTDITNLWWDWILLQISTWQGTDFGGKSL